MDLEGSIIATQQVEFISLLFHIVTMEDLILIVLLNLYSILFYFVAKGSSKTKHKKRRVYVSGQRVTAIHVVNQKRITDITASFDRKTYATEKSFLETLDAHVKQCFSSKDHVEIECGSYTRIYIPGGHPKVLGLSSTLGGKPPVKKAYVQIVWLFNYKIDVTGRINICAGPRGDFFTGVGGFVRPRDILMSVQPSFWNTLYIEWNGMEEGTATMVGKDDVLTVRGKLYPSIDPY